jgi:chromosome segregation ATPase
MQFQNQMLVSFLNLERKEIELQKIMDEPSAKEEIARLQNNILDLNRERTSFADKMHKILTKTSDLFHDRTVLTLKFIVSEAKVQKAKEEIANASEGLQQLQRDLKSATERLSIYKARAKESHSRYNTHKQKAEAIEYLAILFEQEFQDSILDLESQLADLQAREGLINEVDPQILAEYNDRLTKVFCI